MLGHKLSPAVCLLGFLVACGEPTSAVTGAPSQTQNAVGADGGACLVGQSAACTCPDSDGGPAGSGTKLCYNGDWLICNCTAQSVVSVSTQGACEAGHYEGNFLGEYRSSYNFCGIPIPVAGVDLSGVPPLSLDVVEEQTGAGGEFAVYAITGGQVKGTADGIFPFEGTIEGELTCANKKFTGVFKGWYALGFDVGVDLNKGYFEGIVTADYDASQKKFVNGVWDVKEYQGNVADGWFCGDLFEFGGGGTWEAGYVGPQTVPANTSSADAGASFVGVSDAGI